MTTDTDTTRPQERFDVLKQRAQDHEITARDLKQVGAEQYSRDWWAIYFDEYGLHGAPDGDWTVVHAEDGVVVDAELTDIDLRSALNRMEHQDLL